MMESSTQSIEKTDRLELEKNDWNPEAWVYFIWVVMDRSVYCKIGYSANPTSRFNQVLAGIPERPFRINLLPCLNVEQAKIFEAVFHDHLKEYNRKRGEWFTHPNVRHLNKKIGGQIGKVLFLFQTFGYENNLESLEFDGKYPVLYENGFISHVID